MYQSDGQDEVVEYKDWPRPDVGAPLPIVILSGPNSAVAYQTATDDEWVVVLFSSYASYFGPPNDEAFAAHPLAKRGLHPYGVFEVLNSSWIRLLETQNRIHPFHNSKKFAELKHLIFAFHDETFEVVARSFSWEVWIGQSSELLNRLGKSLKPQTRMRVR